MASDDFLLQLLDAQCQRAQLNEPFLAIMGVVTHPRGGTAHEIQEHHATLAAAGALVGRLLTRVSHTGVEEASPRATPLPTAFIPLGHPALDPGAAVDDLVLRRFPAGALRDRQGFL